MSSIKSTEVRFSGYRKTKAGAELYLPGHSAAAKVQAEVIQPGSDKPEQVEMIPQGDYWVSSRAVPMGSAYRFKIGDDPKVIQATAQAKEDFYPTYPEFKKQGAYWVTDPPAVGSEIAYQIPVPGNPRIRVEKVMPGQLPVPVPVLRKGNNWVFSTDPKAPVGTHYRLAPALDMLEITEHPKYGPFNQIPHAIEAPEKSSVMADIYLDSLVTSGKLAELDRAARATKGLAEPAQGQIPVLPMSNPFQQRAAAPGGGQEAGLRELLPRLQEVGVSSILLKPFIGGDNLSSHRYWTVDPYRLNNSFQSKAAFRESLSELRRSGMKLYADGAFVNQGLEGVHIESNLVHGFKSPYWRWLKYGDENQARGPQMYPGKAYNGYVFGILPTKQDRATGLRTINYNRFAFRVLNDPNGKKYDAARPTFIELYDPQLEDKAGRPIAGAAPQLHGNQDSVHKIKFPISVKELQQKRQQLQKSRPSNTTSQAARALAEKKLFCDWANFRLDKPSTDDSGVKWDGQIDVAMMNTKNPDVVNYLDGAVAYWSRMVMNTHTDNVAQALAQAKKALKTDDPAVLLDAITQRSEVDAADPLKVLPPITNPDVETLDASKLKAILKRTKPGWESKDNGKEFAQRLLNEIPMDVLPVPTLFKANLCYPGFQQALRQNPQGMISNFIDHKFLGLLSSIPGIGHIFKNLRSFFFPPPFEKQLATQMDEIFKQLTSDTQKKLRHSNIQSLLADQLGERIYLSLLTGLDLNEVIQLESDPKKLEDAFYKGMSGNILKADPVTASKLLLPLLNERLKGLKPVQVAEQIEKSLRLLDPKLAAVAEEVIKQREFGLNWRIDAAKEVGDMARVSNAEPTARPRLFQEEVQAVKKFWDQLTGSMRKPFPKAAIIAELTDFEMLANYDQKAAKEARAKLLQGSTFTSLPNLSYAYSPLLQLIGYAQRPDEYGDTQLTPSEFMGKLQAMSEEVSKIAVDNYQNLSASHDYPTTSHALLINPDLFNMDLLKWWGLKDDFGVAIDELGTKACFDEVRQQVGVANLPDVLKKLQAKASDINTFNQPNQQRIRQYFDDKAKGANPATDRPTPYELKGQFVDELFKAIKPEELGLQTQEQMSTLQKALKARMEEPSEAKAMRGAIVNAALQLPWNNGAERPQAERVLWQALDKTTQQWGRHFGYQPLDIAINHVFDHVDTSQLPASFQDNPSQVEAWKSVIYRKATRPVMDNLLKVFAVQNAMPGNPSVYLPDLFAQGGSEWTMNTFGQNRNLIRVDKLQNRGFNEFFDQVGNIFKTRSMPELQVLNDGIVLPITPDNENGVLPIIRDNGKQQAIVLVNTGKPRKLDWNHKAGTGQHYETAHRDVQAQLDNYKPDLSELNVQPGTRYRDAHTGEQFVTNDQGLLVSANDPATGMTLKDSRTLVRLPKAE